MATPDPFWFFDTVAISQNDTYGKCTKCESIQWKRKSFWNKFHFVCVLTHTEIVSSQYTLFYEDK